MIFIRGLDPKFTLDIGIIEKLPSMMRNTNYDYHHFNDVWYWALTKKKDFLFSYLISFHGKKWLDGGLVDFSIYNNDLLWSSIEEKNVEAVKCLLIYPDLFRKEAFTMDLGVSDLTGEFIERGDTKMPAKATNFGNFLNLSIQFQPNKEIEMMLRMYYSKYSNQ